MKVLSTTSSFGTESSIPLDKLKFQGLELIKNPHGKTLTEDQVRELMQKHKPVGLLAGVEPLTKQVMEAGLPELKVISRVGVGWDNVDRQAAEQLSIEVKRTPDAVTQSVVELTVGLFLDVARKISLQDAQVKSGSFSKQMGSLLSGKNLGIIGYGRIGRGVARVMRAFGCKIGVYDPYVDVDVCLKDNLEAKFASLSEMFKICDLISIHSTYDKSQHHLINSSLFEVALPGLILVNVARGGIVDEEALLQALQSGKIAGAGLDVFEKEPYTGPLQEQKNVVLTPHIGSYSRESRIRMEVEAVDNLLQSLGRKS